MRPSLYHLSYAALATDTGQGNALLGSQDTGKLRFGASRDAGIPVTRVAD